MTKADETIQRLQDKVDANRKAHPRMNSLAFTVDDMATALDIIADLKESTCNYTVHCAMRHTSRQGRYIMPDGSTDPREGRFSCYQLPFKHGRDLLEDLGIQVIDDPVKRPDTCGECRFCEEGENGNGCFVEQERHDLTMDRPGRPACHRGIKK